MIDMNETKLTTVEQDRRCKEHLLAKRAAQQRRAAHRCDDDDGQRRADRDDAQHAVDPMHVARTAFVVDGAGGHEQRAL